jgi:hypothetical protein
MAEFIENEPDSPAVHRCGHNFEIPACPYRYCAARQALVALQSASVFIEEEAARAQQVMEGIGCAVAMAGST